MDTRTNLPRRGRMDGRVLRKDGSPVAGASIIIDQAPGPFPDVAPVTDDNGHFSLSDLLPGEWGVRALGPGGERGQAGATVEAGGIASVAIYVM